MEAATRAAAGGRSRWVRATLILIPAILVVALLAWGLAGESTAPRPGDEAPDFTAPLLQGGGSLSLSELRGKPVVLNFWASWCVPCEDEAPVFEQAHETFGRRVTFVGVNIKDRRSDALRFYERFKVPYPSVRDEGGRIYDAYGLTGQPETFFIDARGRIVEHIPGAITDQAMMDALVRSLLAGGR